MLKIKDETTIMAKRPYRQNIALLLYNELGNYDRGCNYHRYDNNEYNNCFLHQSRTSFTRLSLGGRLWLSRAKLKTSQYFAV